MSEPTVHVVTDLPAPKKPFYLNKTYVKTVVAAAAVTTVAFVVYKNRARFEDDIDVVVALAS